MCGHDRELRSGSSEERKPEDIFVDRIKQEIGVDINPQAWRMFLRHNKQLSAVLFHRIVDQEPRTVGEIIASMKEKQIGVKDGQATITES